VTAVNFDCRSCSAPGATRSSASPGSSPMGMSSRSPGPSHSPTSQ
jgi:hypothetical protein